jgi:phosphate acetyltransferase
MAFEFESNALMAKNLGAPVLIVVSGKNKTASQLFKSAINIYRNFLLRDVQVLGVVANMVNPEEADRIKQALTNQLPAELLIAVIPTESSLQSPTMKEITLALGAEVLFGSELLDNQVDNFVTGAMMLPNFLRHIKDNLLIVTPGDRGDIIIGALQANLSANYPKIAGIVLTAGSLPDEPIIKLIEGLQTIIPIIAVKKGTFETTTTIGGIHSKRHWMIKLSLLAIRELRHICFNINWLNGPNAIKNILFYQKEMTNAF